MYHKMIKNIFISIGILLLSITMSKFVIAEETLFESETTVSDTELNTHQQSETVEEENNVVTTPILSPEEKLTPAKLKERLGEFEKNAPVIIKLYKTDELISGAQVTAQASVGILDQTGARDLYFKWFLKKNGVDQEVALSNQGKGKTQFYFIPESSGYYEIRAQATDSQGGMRESEPLSIPVGDNLLVNFQPLKPVQGQKVRVEVSAFSNESGYQWYVDGKEQVSNSSFIEFVAQKGYGQKHKIRVIASSKDGIISRKVISIPMYQPEVVVSPAIDGFSVANQAGQSHEFLIKGEKPVVVNAEASSFIDADQARYIWSVDGVKINEGIGKKSILIDPKDIGSQSNENGEYNVSVLVSSPDLKHIASSEVTMNRIAEYSSLAAVNPEKVSPKPLVAESRSFFASFDTARKLVMPLMVVMFLVLIVLGRTQPERVE